MGRRVDTEAVGAAGHGGNSEFLSGHAGFGQPGSIEIGTSGDRSIAHIPQPRNLTAFAQNHERSLPGARETDVEVVGKLKTPSEIGGRAARCDQECRRKGGQS